MTASNAIPRLNYLTDWYPCGCHFFVSHEGASKVSSFVCADPEACKSPLKTMRVIN